MPRSSKSTLCRSIFTIIILSFFLLSPFSIKPVSANAITTNTALDLIADDGFCSLREAIINANDGAQTHVDCAPGITGENLITLPENVNTITLQHGMLPAIYSEIRIEGKGPNKTIIQAANCNPTEFDCSHEHPVFTVGAGGSLTLEGLTVRHGRYYWGLFRNARHLPPILGMGGGINNFGDLSLINCNVSHNLGSVGGGIHNMGKLSIEDSRIINNKAEFGAGLLNSGDLVMSNSHISNNSAELIGGGVANTSFSYYLVLDKDQNMSINEQDLRPSKISTDIDNSQIIDNQSRFFGGGLFNGGWIVFDIGPVETSQIEPTYEIFVEEQKDLLPRPPLFNTKINQTTFAGNTSEIGGGITTVETMSVNASTLSKNQADLMGGGLAMLTGQVNVTNSSFSGNSAGWLGGGLFIEQGKLNLIQNTLAGNLASGIYVEPSPLSDVTATRLRPPEVPGGGVFAFEDASVKISNTIIAKSKGGDCVLEDGAALGSRNNLVQDGSCKALLDGDPRLHGLGDNGGATKTFALKSDSPAIDQGDVNICSSSPISRKDQRGEARLSNACDIGAFEHYEPTVLPDTGFNKGEITALPQQPASKAYASTNLVLEIPTLGTKATIVGVPQSEKSWDVSWLGNSAGYLYGSAFPTWPGNTVLTGHVWNADNTPGIFSDLKAMRYGDQVIIHAFGSRYTYQVRDVRLVGTGDLAGVFQPEELDWVTLVTCETYDTVKDVFNLRRVVRAVLVDIE
ncbi:MAG: sortase [Brevefilum sp.]